VLIMYGFTALIGYGAVGLAVLPAPLAITLVVVGVVGLLLVVGWPRLQRRAVA
jgi:hypothetical protein